MKIKIKHGKGSHLTVDVFDCKADLNSKILVNYFLNELPDLIGMKKISKPLVFDYKAGSESGITGVVVIAESHIAIHTYPNKNYFCADIFSCKEFDYKKAINYMKEKFQAKKIKHKLLKRGYNETS